MPIIMQRGLNSYSLCAYIIKITLCQPFSIPLYCIEFIDRLPYRPCPSYYSHMMIMKWICLFDWPFPSLLRIVVETIIIFMEYTYLVELIELTSIVK